MKRFLRHPLRWADDRLWEHYAPDATELFQQILDHGDLYIPPGRWKISGQLNVPMSSDILGDGVATMLTRVFKEDGDG